MSKPMNPDERKKPARPYSPLVKSGHSIYISGQIAKDPSTGMLAKGDITVQTKQVLSNIFGLLASIGQTKAQIVKTTVYLTRVDDFEAMNAVYREAFGENFPARSTVCVKALMNPEALIEIEAIASLPQSNSR